MVVDLRLAQTYVPAFLCLGKGTFLILFISKFPLGVPLLMVMCTFMYIDRSARNESIFDSNAMLCTILASHIVNIFRSDPQNHQLFLTSLENSSSNFGLVCQFLMTFSSIFLILGFDIAGSFLDFFICPLPSKSKQKKNRKYIFSSFSRGITIVLNGVLLICVLQTPIDRSSVVSTSQIISRSYAFLILCLIWTYAVGVGDMIKLISIYENHRHNPFIGSSLKGNKKNFFSSTMIIQSFVPCHLRFTYLLLVGGNTLYIVGSASALSILFYIYYYQKIPSIDYKEVDLDEEEIGDDSSSSNYHRKSIGIIDSDHQNRDSFLTGPTPIMYANYNSSTSLNDNSSPIFMTMAPIPIYPPSFHLIEKKSISTIIGVEESSLQEKQIQQVSSSSNEKIENNQKKNIIDKPSVSEINIISSTGDSSPTTIIRRRQQQQAAVVDENTFNSSSVYSNNDNIIEKEEEEDELASMFRRAMMARDSNVVVASNSH